MIFRAVARRSATSRRGEGGKTGGDGGGRRREYRKGGNERGREKAFLVLHATRVFILVNSTRRAIYRLLAGAKVAITKGSRRKRGVARMYASYALKVRERKREWEEPGETRFWDFFFFFFSERDACDSCRGDTNVTVLCPGAGRSRSKDKDIVLSVYVWVCVCVYVCAHRNPGHVSDTDDALAFHTSRTAVDVHVYIYARIFAENPRI